MNVNNPGLSLWLAYPTDLSSPQSIAACMAFLSDDERARWQTFRFDRDRNQYLATRVLVRTALAHRLRCPPGSLAFSRNAWGKPALHPDCGVRFNLANCPGLVACLSADGMDVGIDAEPQERAPQLIDLRSEFLSPLEDQQLDSLPADERPDRALSIWTLKEALVKALGQGLSLPLHQISFLFDREANIQLAMAGQFSAGPGQDWRFCLLDHAGHRLALALRSATVPDLERWEVRLPPASPQPLPIPTTVWHPLRDRM